ncbi:hypothetical protein [Embleya sp. NPDC001921]
MGPHSTSRHGRRRDTSAGTSTAAFEEPGDHTLRALPSAPSGAARGPFLSGPRVGPRRRGLGEARPAKSPSASGDCAAATVEAVYELLGA